VDIVMHHSDGDTVLLDASLAAGARGVVIVGTGAGNANPQVAERVRRAAGDGVLVAVSTRVAAGAVAPLYTGGGAVDLVAAGAQLAGTLRPAQTRIALLATLLSADSQPESPSETQSEAPSGCPAVSAPNSPPEPARTTLRRVLDPAPPVPAASELYLADGVRD
jgi:L-asparaginase